jgi:nucleoside transporter
MTSVTPRLRRPTFARLSIMMLLQYMTYGSWWATIGLVLVSNGLGSIVGLAFSLSAIAAIISPMITGAIADRFFASQKVLAILHAVGGCILLALTPIVNAGNGAILLLALFVYMLFFQPTLAMTNNIAFTHIPEKSNSFAYIRAFGTGGWIVMGLVIGQSGLSASTSIFVIAAVMSFVLAAYSLTLPKTPPPARGTSFAWGDVIGAGAFHLFRNRSFRILVFAVLLTCVPISIYNSYGSTYLDAAGVPNVASFMTIGQASEVICLLLVPLILRRFSIKWVLFVGILAWVVRAALLLSMSEGNVPLAVIVIALHGVCNDFFLMTAFMYVDDLTRLEARAQAQSLFVFLSLGVGNAIGAFVAGELYNTFVGSSTDLAAWDPMWYLTAALTAVAALVFLFFFRSRVVRMPSPPSRSDAEALASARVFEV